MAPHEEDKAMDGLLRRNLARDADQALVCPEPEVLAAYFERSLDADETETYELHFSQCARCREQLAAMARAGAPVGSGRGWGSGEFALGVAWRLAMACHSGDCCAGVRNIWIPLDAAFKQDSTSIASRAACCIVATRRNAIAAGCAAIG